MFLGIDVDGTIAMRNTAQWIKVCNEVLKLNISPERLEQISYRDFLQLPEVSAYRKRVGAEYSQRAIGWIDFHPKALLSMLPLQDAVTGVSKLASICEICYYTARYSPIVAQQQEIASATKQWLERQGFPSPDNVVFCESVADKLIKLADYVEASSQATILIDDRYQRLLEAFAQLDAGQHPTLDDDHCLRSTSLLRRHLTIVAYKTTPSSQDGCAVPVIPFISWQEADALIELVSRRFV
jgi:hypothetical protein